MSDPNTRKEKRTPVTLKIKFKSATLDQFIERYSVDVSHGEIFIRTKDPLPVGTQLRFEFQLQDASPLISGEGTVVWTREHDPARVGVAPGMGVRFDKLASESQAVLDKILAMKSKESGEPKFDALANSNDPKTKVAPAPLVSGLAAQSAEKTRVAPAPTAPGGPRATVMGLGPQVAVPPSGNAPAAGKAGPVTGKPNTVPAKQVGNLSPSRGGFPDEPSRDATPLPKPMPFSSVDDDFSEEAFNQPTRVAGSFEDLLRKAEQEAAANEGKGAAAKEPAPAIETKVTVLPAPASAQAGNGSNGASVSKGSGEVATANAAAAERRAAEQRAAEENEIKAAAEKRAAAEKKAAEDKAAADRKAAEKKAAEAKLTDERAAEAARPGVAARRSGTQPTLPSVDYREKKKGSPVILVIVGLIVIVGGAAVYAYSKRGTGETTAQNPPGEATAPTPATNNVPPPVVDPNAGKPAAVVTADAAVVAPPPPAPKGIEVQVVSTPAGAAVMADGKQVGTTPFSLPNLEEGKSYDVSLELPCYQAAKLSIDATKEKASDSKVEATLKPLPRVVRVDSEPKGGAIWIDGVNTGKQSPADVPLAGKLDPTKPHKVMVKKTGYQNGETEIAPDAACTAENGKAVLIAQLTLAEVEKKAPPVADVKVKTPKVRPPKEPPVPDDGTPPTGLLPKDPNAPKDGGTPANTPPKDVTPPKEPPKETPKETPKEPTKEPTKDNPDDHAPDWMKEG